MFYPRSRAAHGARYDYSRADYTTTKHPVEIICRLHGSFFQKPEKHWSGQHCPRCAEGVHKPKMGLATFAARGGKLYDNFYDYSRGVYESSKSPILIICPLHGEFWQIVEYHLAGNGCPACGRLKIQAAQISNLEELRAKVVSVHGDRYAFPRAIYVRSQVPITVTCREHGDFAIRPDHLLGGSGCTTCGIQQRADSQRLSTPEYLSRVRANNTHTRPYGYPRTLYRGAKRKIEVVCPLHGVFWQEASAHHRSGCPVCVHHHTKPQIEIEEFITSLGVSFSHNIRSIIAPKELDIYIPEASLAIELNGTYWHSLTGRSQSVEKFTHRDKYHLCRDRKIRLLQIEELSWRDAVTKEVWKSLIRSKLGLHERIAARKTRFQAISAEVASAFLTVNHLQGAPPAPRWSFGLFLEKELMAVITFSHHEKTALNLTRMAFRLNTTIVGGARKLFSHAKALLPALPIVTFSDNLYSDGSIYPVIGFTLDKELAPSYQWFFKNKLSNKRLFRHKRLPVVLGDAYCPELTEHQNMYAAGARCLYDAGYQRWVYPETSGIEVPASS